MTKVTDEYRAYILTYAAALRGQTHFSVTHADTIDAAGQPITQDRVERTDIASALALLDAKRDANPRSRTDLLREIDRLLEKEIAPSTAA